MNFFNQRSFFYSKSQWKKLLYGIEHGKIEDTDWGYIALCFYKSLVTLKHGPSDQRNISRGGTLLMPFQTS